MTIPVDLLRKCWFLAGPTASGKTAASLELAQRLNAEIVSLDSMTLYRRMDIGTAKATPAERAGVPHHLIDVLDPQDEYSLAEYVQAALVVSDAIVSRGRTPLFVGGTGLYLRGILRGVFEGPAADWELRSRLETLSQVAGPFALHDRLQQVDPVTATRLHPNDQRRVIRALEVFELTGQPLSVLQQNGPRPIDDRPRAVYWISPPRDWLYRRIDDRVDQMFSQGLIDEVQRLMAAPGPLSHTARQALGYKEVIDWLESQPPGVSINGSDFASPAVNQGLLELKQLIQTRTRQFAKRQHTWFRNLEECCPIEISGEESAAEIADLVLAKSKLVEAEHAS